MKTLTRVSLIVAFLAIWAIGFVSCAPNSSITNLPFAISMSNDTAFAQLSADEALYQPGDEAIFEVTLKNKGDEPWLGRYCVKLLGDTYPPKELAQDDFMLQANEQFTQEVRVRLPEDLALGAYGLALVVPDEFTVVSKLAIGNDSDFPGETRPESICQ